MSLNTVWVLSGVVAVVSGGLYWAWEHGTLRSVFKRRPREERYLGRGHVSIKQSVPKSERPLPKPPGGQR